MDQALNVDRYLTQRVGVVRRLLDAELPAPAAERWVAAWEAEAHLRGLDPGDDEWWRSAWEWIAQDCGASDDAHEPAQEWRTGPFAEITVREWPIRVMDAIHRTSDVIAAFRAWLDARASYRASDPGAPDHEWLRREMKRLCAAYEAAVGEAPRTPKIRKPART